jgi:D-sedoheptulose 7-phosphate isomerase
MEERCSVLIRIPSDETPRIQEGHILVYHILCELIEQAVCGAVSI